MKRSRFRSLPGLWPAVRWPVLRTLALAVAQAPKVPALPRSAHAIRPGQAPADPASPELAGRGQARPAPPGHARRGNARQRRATGLPGRGGQAGRRADRSAPGLARTGGGLPVLALTCTVEQGQGGPLATAVLGRVLAAGHQTRSVVLDLRQTASLDEEACAALHGLLDALRPAGVTLRLATGLPRVRAQLADAGLSRRLGTAAVQPTLRAAVLAEYAALPGPGLVTGEVLTALMTPAEPLDLAGPPAAPGTSGLPGAGGALHPLRVGRAPPDGGGLCPV